MDRDDVWRAIDDQRRHLTEALEDLSEQEWHHPSLCRGWTVRQVAAHVALQNTTWSMMPRAVLDMVKSGGMNGAIHKMACRHAKNPTSQIVAEIRDRIGVGDRCRPSPAMTRPSTISCTPRTSPSRSAAAWTCPPMQPSWRPTGCGPRTGCSMPARSSPGTGSSPPTPSGVQAMARR